MKTAQVIATAAKHLQRLQGRVLDVLSVAKPVSPEAAVNLAKVISKLSPLVGNMIEFNTCEFLNDQPEFQNLGKWKRQDPGFPDVILDGHVTPAPGFEVKAWFPLATEITARFKDSQNHFLDDRTYVAMIAWLPEFLIFGRPVIIGVFVASGASVAKARDNHYHNPPDYLVLEPEDTKKRTRNLRQTNTNGYKWQSSDDPKVEAVKKKEVAELIKSWGANARKYSAAADYQAKLRKLRGMANYRLDTNFAKIDRVGHSGIEAFAKTVYDKKFHGRRIGEWGTILSGRNDSLIKKELAQTFNITDTSERLIK